MSRESIHTEILQRLTLSLSLCVFVCVCMCMCMCVRVFSIIWTGCRNWELPWARIKEPSEAMRFGYAVRQAEIRHQALLEQSFLALWTWQSRTPFLLFQCMFFLSVCAQSYTTHQTWLERTWPTQIVCEADGAVGTFVPLPVESEMCRKVWNVSFFSCFCVFWCFGFRTYGSKLSGAYFHFNV